jgi:hypothetical protein
VRMRDGLVIELKGCADRATAMTYAGGRDGQGSATQAHHERPSTHQRVRAPSPGSR